TPSHGEATATADQAAWRRTSDRPVVRHEDEVVHVRPCRAEGTREVATPFNFATVVQLMLCDVELLERSPATMVEEPARVAPIPDVFEHRSDRRITPLFDLYDDRGSPPADGLLRAPQHRQLVPSTSIFTMLTWSSPSSSRRRVATLTGRRASVVIDDSS